MPLRDQYRLIGPTFIKHVGDTERNQFFLPQVKALPGILNEFLDKELTYEVLLNVRALVLETIIKNGFVDSLQQKFKNGCKSTIEAVHANILSGIENLQLENAIYMATTGGNTLDEYVESELLTDPEAHHLYHNGRLTVGGLLIHQPELVFAISFNKASKK